MLVRESVEFVDWQRDKVEEAAMTVMFWYAKNLAPLGTNHWVKFAMEGLIPILRGKTSRPTDIQAPSFSLRFSWPNPILLAQTKGDQVKWEELDPKFTLIDRTRGALLPRFRSLFYQTNLAIAEEAAAVYKLQSTSNPFSLTFPKEHYARVQVLEGQLLA